MAEIQLRDVTKRYPDGTEAVKHADLDISDGELIIGGELVNDLPPKDRDIAMVFQNYALYPHMTVRENMGFALKLAKVSKSEIDKKVDEAAEILELGSHLDRKPA